MSTPERFRVGNHVTIYARGKNKIYVADFWRDGKHERRSLKTGNKKVAIDRAVKLDAALADGTFKSPPPPTTIAKVIAGYIEYLKTENRARKTIVRYRGELTKFRDFAASQQITRLSQVTPTLFDQFRAHCKRLGHKPRTLFHESVVVKQFMKWATKRGLVAQNALADYKLIKPVLEPREGPNLEQVDSILLAVTGQRQVQCAVLAFTGMRSGEMQRLRLEDVDLTNGWIKIVSRDGAETKTRQSRKVPIHPRLRSLLMTLPKRKGPWFFTAVASRRYPKGDHLTSPKRLNDHFVELLGKLGMPAGRDSHGFTIHSLRHFFETLCVNSGIPQRVIDTWLGHRSDQSMAAVYYKLSDAESKAFMEKVPFGTGKPAADADNKEV